MLYSTLVNDSSGMKYCVRKGAKALIRDIISSLRENPILAVLVKIVFILKGVSTKAVSEMYIMHLRRPRAAGWVHVTDLFHQMTGDRTE